MLSRKHADLFDIDYIYSEPHPALFGDGPNNTYWQMAHGAGGGVETVANWIGDSDLWERASRE